MWLTVVCCSQCGSTDNGGRHLVLPTTFPPTWIPSCCLTRGSTKLHGPMFWCSSWLHTNSAGRNDHVTIMGFHMIRSGCPHPWHSRRVQWPGGCTLLERDSGTTGRGGEGRGGGPWGHPQGGEGRGAMGSCTGRGGLPTHLQPHNGHVSALLLFAVLVQDVVVLP